MEIVDQLYSEALLLLDDYLNQMPYWQLKGHTLAETSTLFEESDYGEPVPLTLHKGPLPEWKQNFFLAEEMINENRPR